MMMTKPGVRTLKTVAVAAAVALGVAAGGVTPVIAQVSHPWLDSDDNFDQRLSPNEFALAVMKELRPLDANNDRLLSRDEFLAGKSDEELFVHAGWFDESDFDSDGAWSVGELEDYLVFRFLEYDVNEDAAISGDEFPDVRVAFDGGRL